MKFLKIPIPPFFKANSMHIIIKLNYYNFLCNDDSRIPLVLNLEPSLSKLSPFFLFYDFVLLIEPMGDFLAKPFRRGFWKLGINLPEILDFYGFELFLTFSESACLLKILVLMGFCLMKFFRSNFLSLNSESFVFYFLSFLF